MLKVFQRFLLLFISISFCDGHITWTPVCRPYETQPDPEGCMFSPGIIHTRWGYPVHTYEVTTADGYILTMFRIPYGKNGPAADNSCIRPVAFLQHGLLGSSDTFLTNLPNQSLAYILADLGFDVWLGNVRGCRYSRAHWILDPNKSWKYWQFSWQDMAEKDLPTMINKVLEVTGQNQLDYIAHSQGTLIGFAKFSEDQQFAQKIRTFYALAPVSTLVNMTSRLKELANPWILDLLQATLDWEGVHEIGTSDGPDQPLSEYFCLSDLKWEKEVCKNVLFWIEGFNKNYTNVTRVPVYTSHSPAGTSVKNMVHFAQNIRSGKMQKYDYGKRGNMKVYGQKTPPLYDVEKLQVPTVLFSGVLDSFADPQDVATLTEKLRKVVKNHYIYKDFMHLDFTYGLGASTKVYPHIIYILKNSLQDGGYCVR